MSIHMNRNNPQLLAIALIACAATTAHAGDARRGFGPWSDPQSVFSINTTAAAEGCPIESPDGRELYIASNRSAPGAQGKLDIYRSFRSRHGGGWTQPENLGAPVNSPEFEYCPTPLPGPWLLFISSHAEAGDCYPGNTPPPAPPRSPAVRPPVTRACRSSGSTGPPG